MKHRLSIFAAIILSTVFASQATFAQNDTSLVNAIMQYTAFIDSVSEERPADFSSSIADGVIKTDDNMTGGFGISTLSNLKRDTAFRIVYSGSLDIDISKIYYFKDNKLVYAKLAFRDVDTGGKLFYQREEYYYNNRLVSTKTDGGENAEKYASRAAFSLFEDGSRYMTDFKQERR